MSIAFSSRLRGEALVDMPESDAKVGQSPVRNIYELDRTAACRRVKAQELLNFSAALCTTGTPPKT